MTSEDWPEVRLGDHVDLLTGFPFKSAQFSDDPDDVRLARGDNIVQGRFRWDGVRRWSRTDLGSYANYLLEPGDVVLAMDRPWIEVGLKYAAVSPEDQPCLLVQRVSRLRGIHGLSTRFLRYVVGSRAFTEHVLAVQTGTAVPHISGRQIADFRFLLPPPAEQERIAETLGAFDNKIELNGRMSHILESIARAVFKSWFIDFDPVCRKMEGKSGGEVGLPPSLAALFPDSRVPSSLVDVPKGWRIGRCDEDFSVAMGQSPPGESYNEHGEGMAFYQGRRDFGARYPTVRVFCTAPSRLAQAGDTLVSVRAPVGDINLAGTACCIGRGVAAVRHSSGSIAYTHEMMRSLRSVFDDFESGGTVFGAIGGKDFRSLPVVIPPRSVVGAFENLVAPIAKRLDGLDAESRLLTAVRDTLLSRLLSGEIRTPTTADSLETSS